jgi:hypothetical protein
MPLVSGYQVICPSGVRALDKNVIVRITGHLGKTRGHNHACTVLDQLQELLTKTLSNVQLRPAQDVSILGQNWLGYVPPRRFSKRH